MINDWWVSSVADSLEEANEDFDDLLKTIPTGYSLQLWKIRPTKEGMTYAIIAQSLLGRRFRGRPEKVGLLELVRCRSTGLEPALTPRIVRTGERGRLK